VNDRGLLARAVGIITAPTETFRIVLADPRPASILFLVCLVIGLAVGLPQFTETGRQAALDLQVQQAERISGAPVSTETYAQMEQFSHYNAWPSFGSMFVFVPILTMLVAAVYWALFNILFSGNATFKQSLGIVAHSQVINALGAVAAAPIQFVRGAHGASGPFNLSVLVPMLEPGNVVADVFAAVNFFTLWQVTVCAIGLALLYRRRTLPIAVGLLAAYFVLMTAFTVALSSLSR
jgi:hypothetical protein